MSDAPPSPKHDLTEGALLRITLDPETYDTFYYDQRQ